MLLSSHFHRSLLPSTTSRFHHHHLQNNSATHQQQQCLQLSSPTFNLQISCSVTPSAFPAVRGFAFAALSTNLIGYALSFSKQLQDTVELISAAVKNRDYNNCGGVKSTTGVDSCRIISSIVMLVVLGFAIVITSFFKSYDKEEDRLLPGGNGSLLLFVIAVILFIWH